MLRRLLKIAAVLAAFLFVMLLLVIWAMGKADEPIEKQAREFCSAVYSGQPAQEVAKKASDSGAKVHAMAYGMMIRFPGGAGYHICNVETASEKVVSAKYVFM
jgi:hypothetical protein